MMVSVWVEVIPTRRNWQGRPSDLKIGRRWQNRPADNKIAPGAIVVEIELDIPVSRLMNVVRATVPPADPIVVQS